MGGKRLTTMGNQLILWFCVKTNKIINSKPFIFLIGLTIGATVVFCYLEGSCLYNDLFKKVVIVNSATQTFPVAKAGQPEIVPVESGGGVDYLLEKYFGEEKEIAKAVMMCESRGESGRIGDTHLAKPSIGLFQINQIWHPYTTEQLQDPEFNIKIAKEIRDKGSWDRWTCYRTDGYKKFLAVNNSE